MTYPRVDWPVTRADDGTSIARRTAHCQGGAKLTLYEIRGGGHTWPGGVPYLGEWIVGKVSRELDADATIGEFFEQYRLP